MPHGQTSYFPDLEECNTANREKVLELKDEVKKKYCIYHAQKRNEMLQDATQCYPNCIVQGRVDRSSSDN